MGLTIHYRFKAPGKEIRAARTFIEAMRSKALDLPFKEVGEIVDLQGDAADFNRAGRDNPNFWMLIQAQRHLEPVPIRGRPDMKRHYSVSPKRVIAFSAWPGEGCEEANIGLCLYPATLKTEEDGTLRTGGSGWHWSSFCKTQYANEHGMQNFLTCHLAVIKLLDFAKELGILEYVNDEGNYYEKRDMEALVKEIGEWDTMIAGYAGALKDMLGEGKGLQAPIMDRPNFEHLEAKGQETNPPIPAPVVELIKHA